MSDYTPTTEQVRDEYVYGQLGRATSSRVTEESLGGEFDRWLAKHDAEVAARALEAAADEFHARLPDGTGNGRVYNSWRVAAMLRARATATLEETNP